MKNHSVYVGPRVDSGTRLAGVKHPKVGKKERLQEWLQWWRDLLGAWKNREIVALISPDEKYDPIVKMAAKAIGIQPQSFKNIGIKWLATKRKE